MWFDCIACLEAIRTLCRTLVDMGPWRLYLRILYSLRQHLDRNLPPSVAFLLAGVPIYEIAPLWKGSLLPEINSSLSAPQPFPTAQPISLNFNFLNQSKELEWPITWNDPSWDRLWQFNLHYFDYARLWLDLALDNGLWPSQALHLEPLIDHWIADNLPGRGDGWHSYTTSLRIRTWCWLFRFSPALIKPHRLFSLWQQLLWLNSHPENCHGGNHWLENLTSIAIVSLHFDGPTANKLLSRSLRLLSQELHTQILPDGGHEERSASYHLLMLDRLVELAYCLLLSNIQPPEWLHNSIYKMTEWAESVRLDLDIYPRFNDSSLNSSPGLREVIAFAQTYLQPSNAASGIQSTSGLRSRLFKLAKQSALGLNSLSPEQLYSKAVITDLKSTGWSLLRPDDHWVLLFKCGIPCPAHLPAHAHSDQLSLDIIHRGRWILAEAGTSVYGSGVDRQYERSSAAHNTLQLGYPLDSNHVKWVEPVDVWHGFRAGRKAKPVLRASGELGPNRYFFEGSHDGFKSLRSNHHRRVEITTSLNSLVVNVTDTISTSNRIAFRLWWHFGPDLHIPINELFRFHAPTADSLTHKWQNTWFSHDFGQRSLRLSFSLQGYLSPGLHKVFSSFVLPV